MRSKSSAFAVSLILTSLFLIPTLASAAPANTITITDKSGTASSNYPLQFGRPFVQGEIANFPQVRINGTAVPTQADVKNRWPDGSVKFAIVAVMIPSIPANGTVTLSFQNQSSGNNTPLVTSQMLGSNYNFDAKITIATSSQNYSASARTMLQNGSCTPWTSGQIAQTMLCADDSLARIYDMGFDSYRSIRPRFYATFWPATNQVTVRYVGENSNSEALEDMRFNLTLTLGNTSPSTIYTKSNVIDYAATHWTKVFWLGGAPQVKINIDNNLAYLAATTLFPNYDTSIRPAETTIATQYNYWLTKPKDLYEVGSWVQYMPQTGQTAGPAVGPYPQWVVNWLYTGDWRMREQVLGNADLAGAWPNQVREGQSGRTFISGTDALGKPVSLNARPMIRLFDVRYTDADQVKIKGTRIVTPSTYPTTWGGWMRDTAHEPDPFSAAYALTGDYWYLEEMNMWSATDIAYEGFQYRGPSGSAFGGIYNQTRGEGWMFRNLTSAALLNPDTSAEKTYFTKLVNDAIAIWEGNRSITGTAFQNTPQWQWGNTLSPGISNSPLRYWRALTMIEPSEVASVGDANAAMQIWQDSMLLYSLGLAKERGFATEALLKWMAPLITAQLNDPSYDPRLIAAGETPVGDSRVGRYTRWSQVQAQEPLTAQSTTLAYFTGGINTYGIVAANAASMITDKLGGASAWNWLVSNVRNKTNYTTTMTAWDILPRTPAVPSSAPYVFLNANPTLLPLGGSTVLTWFSTNATSCTGTGFTVSGTSGSVTVVPSSATTYTVTCSGPGGTSASSVSVTVGSTGLAPTLTLTVTPTSIATGASATLAWSSTNATSCTASGGWTGTKAASGSFSVTPSVTTTYTLTCTGSTGSIAKNVTITVGTTTTMPTATLSANPTSITAGQSSTLSWSSTGASSCTGVGFSAGLTSGSVSVTPTVTTTYSITCSGAGGTSAPRTATVSVSTVTPTSLIQNLTTTGDFSQTNTCISVTSAGQSCSVSLTFTPTAAGIRTGTFSFKDMADGTTHIVSLSGTGVTATTTPPPPPTGLVGYWKFDGTLDDSVGGKATVASGTLAYASGQIGQGLVLSGSNSYVSVPKLNNLVPPYSVSFWVNSPTIASGVMVYGGRGNGCLANPDIRWSNGKIIGRHGACTGGIVATSADTFAANTWHHVTQTITADGSLVLYVDGKLEGSASGSTPNTYIQGCIFFGASETSQCANPGTYLNGTLDDVRIYNRVLSATEVGQLYTAGSAGQTAAAGNTNILSTLSNLLASLRSQLVALLNPSANVAAITLSQTSLTFGSVTVGQTSAVQSVTITASGATPPPPPSTIQIGSRVKTTVNLNVRAKPNTKSGKIICTQAAGALGTVIAGPATNQGYIWWSVNYDTSCDGWSAVDGGYLVPL